jgi:hypothetical protein
LIFNINFRRRSHHVLTASATGCGQPATCSDDGSGYLSSTVCGTSRNFHGSLAERMACLAAAPSTSCQEVRPLEELRRFAEAAARDDGRRRAEANLAVLILTGSDDTSGVAPTSITQTLENAGVDLATIVLAAVGLADCPGTTMPMAPRLATAIEALNGSYIAPCSPSWITQVVNLLAYPHRTPSFTCIGPLRDVDPMHPGLQPLIRVLDASTSEGGVSHSGELASCGISAPPCWTWEPSHLCPMAQGLFNVVRPLDFCPGLSRTVVDFATCANPADPACAVSP